MQFTIGSHTISEANPVFIIAELSANHNQNYDVAVKSIRAAKKAGANAVKLQTYTPDTITLNCHNEYFQLKHGTIWDGKSLYDLYTEALTPWAWHEPLQRIAEDEGLEFFSSPFDKTAVDFLEALNVPAYKIASFEITDIPLIRYAASKGKPIIISTGLASPADIEEAVQACRSVGNDKVSLLKCTSAYPTPYRDVHLKTLPELQRRFGALPGLSDHTKGVSVPIGAVALGARIIEKHFILDRSLGGPDASFSLEPEEFKLMVDSVRQIEAALGTIQYPTPEENKSWELRRSLFVVEDILPGSEFTEQNIRSVRPGYGLSPKYFEEILGKRSSQAIKKGTPLSWGLINK